MKCTSKVISLAAVLMVMSSLQACETETVGPFCDRDEQCPASRLCNKATRICAGGDAAVTDAQDAAGPEQPGSDGGSEDAGGVDAAAPPECKSTAECVALDPGRPLCVTGKCVPCTAGPGPGGSSCADVPLTPVCAAEGPLAGQCVTCTPGAQGACTGMTPICDAATNSCRTCGQDAECAVRDPAGPGICMDHEDGRCASAAETVVVQGTNLQAALEASQGKALVLVKGNTKEAIYAGPGKIAIIGAGATRPIISGGGVTSPGLDVTGGEVFLRNLEFQLSNPGLKAKASTIHIRNCSVSKNRGGIVLDDAAFTIENTSASDNDEGMYSNNRFGGILVQSPRSPKRLRNVQINDNKEAGLKCIGGSIDLDSTVTAARNKPMMSPEFNIDTTCRP
ncbi:MAG: hypothetical protein KA712_20435 [Myxococcales bacterium]|nr:hypothetical protein [Myxococcales bacterium]